MALVNSDLYNEQNETFKRTTGNTDFPRLKTIKVPLQSETAVTTADDVLLIDLPVGCVVRPDLSTKHIDYATDSSATSTTFILGDSADDNRYSLSDVHAATGEYQFVITTAQPDALTTPFAVTEATKTLYLGLSAISGTWAAGENIGHLNLVIELP